MPTHAFAPKQAPVAARPASRRDAGGVREVLRSPGQPLESAALAFYRGRMGRDFSGVRVHTGADAAASAAAVGARAYAVGRHVVFGGGHGPGDGRLMVHELAHVAQQEDAASSAVPAALDLAPPDAERAAGDAAEAISRGGEAPAQPRQPLQLARQAVQVAQSTLSRVALDLAENVRRQMEAQQPRPPSAEASEKPLAVTVPPGLQAPAATPAAASKPKRAQPGASGIFSAPKQTPALTRWEYVVYADHVRLGNRAVSDTPPPGEKKPGGGPVIGAWPWMTNNPGDLTGSIVPQKVVPTGGGPATYRQDERVWGRAILEGATPGAMAPVTREPYDARLSDQAKAIEGAVARRDLAIFPDLPTGKLALKEWAQKYYKGRTLAAAVAKHLGPVSSHVEGVDRPEDYPKAMQRYLDEIYLGKYPKLVFETKVEDIPEDAWEAIVGAYAAAEGYYNRRADTRAGSVSYYVNAGIVYRCGGKDPVAVDPAFARLRKVTSLPQATPPEIKALLGCP